MVPRLQYGAGSTSQEWSQACGRSNTSALAGFLLPKEQALIEEIKTQRRTALRPPPANSAAHKTNVKADNPDPKTDAAEPKPDPKHDPESLPVQNSDVKPAGIARSGPDPESKLGPKARSVSSTVRVTTIDNGSTSGEKTDAKNTSDNMVIDVGSCEEPSTKIMAPVTKKPEPMSHQLPKSKTPQPEMPETAKKIQDDSSRAVSTDSKSDADTGSRVESGADATGSIRQRPTLSCGNTQPSTAIQKEGKFRDVADQIEPLPSTVPAETDQAIPEPGPEPLAKPKSPVPHPESEPKTESGPMSKASELESGILTDSAKPGADEDIEPDKKDEVKDESKDKAKDECKDKLRDSSKDILPPDTETKLQGQSAQEAKQDEDDRPKDGPLNDASKHESIDALDDKVTMVPNQEAKVKPKAEPEPECKAQKPVDSEAKEEGVQTTRDGACDEAKRSVKEGETPSREKTESVSSSITDPKK